MSVYYFAAFTDSGCVLGCPHKHQTVSAAAACISEAGGYVVAVENDVTRALTDEEEEEFQHAMYGSAPKQRVITGCMMVLAILSR
jgi:hypothetical protein